VKRLGDVTDYTSTVTDVERAGRRVGARGVRANKRASSRVSRLELRVIKHTPLHLDTPLRQNVLANANGGIAKQYIILCIISLEPPDDEIAVT
jgi:hypothetical protein